MLQDVLDDLEAKNQKTAADLKRELAKIRTGRANLGMLDGIRVEYYGAPTPLNQVATLRIADPRLITIQPFERTLIGDIERAISTSDLGLNPSNDGMLIRVPIPMLSGERRQELAKVARRAGEDHKITVRNHRREANDMLKDLEKESEITEDQMHKGFDQVNQMTDRYTSQVDAIVEAKEKEILEV